MNPRNFVAELKRRNVYKVAVAYAVVGWLAMQVAATVVPALHLPDGITTAVVVLTLVGFPIALVIAWVFEMTPEGMKRTENVSPDEVLPQWSTRKFAAMIVSIALLAAALFVFQMVRNKSIAPARPRAASELEKSIAVLPFTDLSPGHDQEYFSDGMSEEILNALSQVKDLKVTGRTSSFYFKNQNEDLRTIGKILGVANVLEGSVRQQGDKVRITAQLIQTSDGFHLWSDSYDGSLQDVFELQERIARSITEELKVVLVGTQKTRLVPVATESAEAHALYLQATAVLNRRDGAHFPEAISDLERAVRLDPKYARAHARLAAIYSVASTYTATDHNETLSMAEHEAQVASDLDPTLAEPYAVLGLIDLLRRQWLAMRPAFEHAVALDPADSTANLWFGMGQICVGSREEGITSLERALAVDPLLPNALWWRGAEYLDAGDLTRARSMLQKSADNGLSYAEIGLADLAHAEGHGADAISRFATGIQVVLAGFPDGANRILAEGIYGDAVERAKAVAMLDAYLAGKPRTVASAATYSLLRLGEPERALALEENAPTIDEPLFLRELWSPYGAAARKLTQFSKFARKMGLAAYWDKYGPPDGCQRKAPGEYVCE